VQPPPPAPAPQPPGPPDKTQPPWSQTQVTPLAVGAVEREKLAGGRHLRIGTTRGSVHVWLPPGYAPKTAGIALYVHGYYTDVDQAFADHRLAEQFQASGRNAMFIAGEAPGWNGEDVQWPVLGELLQEVAARTGLALPPGPVVVAGHSGAIRTILPWLLHPRVEEVLLLDALYRGEDEVEAWLAAAPPGHRRVVLLGDETAQRTEGWLDSMPRALHRDRFPEVLPPAERRASLVYYRSQYEHMAIVTGGRVLPLLLRGSRLPRI
jgi:hypothetical protein